MQEHTAIHRWPCQALVSGGIACTKRRSVVSPWRIPATLLALFGVNFRGERERERKT